MEKYPCGPKEMGDPKSEKNSIPWFVTRAANAGLLSFYGYTVPLSLCRIMYEGRMLDLLGVYLRLVIIVSFGLLRAVCGPSDARENKRRVWYM